MEMKTGTRIVMLALLLPLLINFTTNAGGIGSHLPRQQVAENPMAGIEVLNLLGEAYDDGGLAIANGYLEGWGCNVSTVGPTQVVSSATAGVNATVDFLVSEMSNITEYDVVIIPGGGAGEALSLIPAVLGLVQDANDAGVVLAGNCGGVYLLAIADVIDGKEVTGWIGHSSSYLAAGASYTYGVPCIVDGNIVTGNHGYQYEFALGIAEALGIVVVATTTSETTSSTSLPPSSTTSETSETSETSVTENDTDEDGDGLSWNLRSLAVSLMLVSVIAAIRKKRTRA